MPAFQPRLCYDDCAAAVDWLQRAFGFTTILRATSGEQVVYADLAFGDARLTVGGEWDNIKPPSALGGLNTQSIYVKLESSVDEHCARARAAGAVILQEPQDMFHGDRTYRARDPQGHIWIFGQKIRDVTKAELEAALPGLIVAITTATTIV